jgi:hypothetical protein
LRPGRGEAWRAEQATGQIGNWAAQMQCCAACMCRAGRVRYMGFQAKIEEEIEISVLFFLEAVFDLILINLSRI